MSLLRNELAVDKHTHNALVCNRKLRTSNHFFADFKSYCFFFPRPYCHDVPVVLYLITSECHGALLSSTPSVSDPESPSSHSPSLSISCRRITSDSIVLSNRTVPVRPETIDTSLPSKQNAGQHQVYPMPLALYWLSIVWDGAVISGASVKNTEWPMNKPQGISLMWRQMQHH